MTYKIVLWDKERPFTAISQRWWINFCNSLAYELSEYNVNQKLKEYHAKYVSANEQIYIEFEDEKYSSMLILRFS
ncbi:MAG TPA: hypothetical protein DCE78_02320 [Bacteroidetes bacterium]|nr:hypothetical protein [Bacteroidota bacterium]